MKFIYLANEVQPLEITMTFCPRQAGGDLADAHKRAQARQDAGRRDDRQRPFRGAPNGFCTPSTRRGGSRIHRSDTWAICLQNASLSSCDLNNILSHLFDRSQRAGRGSVIRPESVDYCDAGRNHVVPTHDI
jgi:hypothetical protein